MDVLSCRVGRTPVYSAPKFSAELETELIYGQLFRAIKTTDGFVEGIVIPLMASKDGLVSKGYVRETDLVPMAATAAHKISTLQASVFSRDHIKSQITARLPFGARVTVAEQQGDFFKLTQGGYIHQQHIAPFDKYEDDFVAVAERHMGLPYIWGGVSSDGLDCSGLVQSALWATGQSCPRNSGEQRDGLGRALDKGTTLKRGDLVFWPGHVGIMQDAAYMIHANAFHMCTASEPLSAVSRFFYHVFNFFHDVASFFHNSAVYSFHHVAFNGFHNVFGLFHHGCDGGRKRATRL